MAFYLGYVAAKHPDAELVVVANDRGYDPMLAHARLLKFRARRVGYKMSVAKKAAVVKPSAPAAMPVAAKKAVAKKIVAKKAVTMQAAVKPAAPAKVATAKKAPAAKKAASAKGSVLLAGSIDRRVVLRADYKGERYLATLRKDGQVSYARELYGSPSAAAKAVVGRAANGWCFWRYKKGAQWVARGELSK